MNSGQLIPAHPSVKSQRQSLLVLPFGLTFNLSVLGAVTIYFQTTAKLDVSIELLDFIGTELPRESQSPLGLLNGYGQDAADES